MGDRLLALQHVAGDRPAHGRQRDLRLPRRGRRAGARLRRRLTLFTICRDGLGAPPDEVLDVFLADPATDARSLDAAGPAAGVVVFPVGAPAAGRYRGCDPVGGTLLTSFRIRAGIGRADSLATG